MQRFQKFPKISRVQGYNSCVAHRQSYMYTSPEQYRSVDRSIHITNNEPKGSFLCKLVFSVRFFCLYILSGSKLGILSEKQMFRINIWLSQTMPRNMQTRKRHICCVKYVYCSGRRSKQRIKGQRIIFEGKGPKGWNKNIYSYCIFHINQKAKNQKYSL